MGEQRNLTEENVEELKKHLERMKETNPDLEYRFFEQIEQKEKELEELLKSDKEGGINHENKKK